MKIWGGLSNEAKLEYQEPLKPLRLVIMSATLRVEDFCQDSLFSPRPPIIRVSACPHLILT